MTARVVHVKREAYDVYVGRQRAGDLGWGNPFSFKEGTSAEFVVASREEAVSKYREWLLAQPALVEKAKQELRGKVLGCWCKPAACHGDVLLEVANEG